MVVEKTELLGMDLVEMLEIIVCMLECMKNQDMSSE